jgi:hypothetical protein
MVFRKTYIIKKITIKDKINIEQTIKDKLILKI